MIIVLVLYSIMSSTDDEGALGAGAIGAIGSTADFVFFP